MPSALSSHRVRHDDGTNGMTDVDQLDVGNPKSDPAVPTVPLDGSGQRTVTAFARV